MIRPGLVSISFRDLSISEIVSACLKANLQAVEWGGDVHVPHGDRQAAKTALNMCTNAGLETPTYGSYYRLGSRENPEFAAVLDCALELQAHTVRIWAGDDMPSAKASPDIRKRMVEECREICEAAARHNVRIATEYHGNTLTDTNESAQAFFKEVGHTNLRTYWQPPNGKGIEYCAEGLEEIVKKVDVLHVFHWGKRGGDDKRPLIEGTDRWNKYLSIAAGHVSWALMEFVAEDSVENLVRDAEVLRNWLDAANATD